MLANRLAELDALLRISHGILECGPCQAKPSGSHIDSSDLHGAQQLGKSFSFNAAHQIFFRNPIVFKIQFTGFKAFIAELINISDNVKPRAFFRDEQADPAMFRCYFLIGFNQKCKGVTMSGVGNKHFCAVDDIFVSVLDRSHFNTLKIASGIGFRQCDTAALFAGGKQREIFLFLFFRTGIGNNIGHDEMAVHDSPNTHPHPCNLFYDEGVGHQIDPGAVVFFGN